MSWLQYWLKYWRNAIASRKRYSKLLRRVNSREIFYEERRSKHKTAAPLLYIYSETPRHNENISPHHIGKRPFMAASCGEGGTKAQSHESRTVVSHSVVSHRLLKHIGFR